MAQPIRPAEVQMDLVSAAEGMTGMRRTAAPPGSQQMLDQLSSPMMSNQPARNMQIAQQTVNNRTMDAATQGMANMQRMSDVAVRDAAEAQHMAKDMRDRTVATILDATSAPATGLLLGEKGLAEKVTRDAMVQQGIGERINPDLSDYSGQLMA